MSNTITVEKAAAGLGELLRSLEPGDELVVTENDQVLGRFIPDAPRKVRRAGACKGMLTIIKEDDEHLKGFEEYM